MMMSCPARPRSNRTQLHKCAGSATAHFPLTIISTCHRFVQMTFKLKIQKDYLERNVRLLNAQIQKQARGQQ